MSLNYVSGRLKVTPTLFFGIFDKLKTLFSKNFQTFFFITKNVIFDETLTSIDFLSKLLIISQY